MISKKEFINILDNIQDIQIKEENLRESLEAFSPDSRCDIFLFIKYDDMVMNLLMDMFEDKYEDIPYFIYEMNFGKEPNKFALEEKDGKETHLYKNAGELYDYLVNNMMKVGEQSNE